MVRPPLDESEMPDVAVSAPGVALVTARRTRREAQPVWPVTVERVRPFRWSERAAAPRAGRCPRPSPRADAPRLFPARRRAIALVLGAVAIALVAAALAAFLAARTSSTLPTFRRVTFRRGMVDGARFGADGGIVYSAQWDGVAVRALPGDGRGRRRAPRRPRAAPRRAAVGRDAGPLRPRRRAR